MNSDEEAFLNFIEVDDQYEVKDQSPEESDSDKENQSYSVNSAKTKPEQINKIVAFVKENNEQLIGKPKYASMWEALSEELNDLGPPKHTVEKWKRIWSVFKYNNRKRLTMILGDGKPSCKGNSSAASLALDSDQQKSKILKHDEELPFQGYSSAALHNDMLSLVLDQQKIIIKKLDKHEGILEDIKKKL